MSVSSRLKKYCLDNKITYKVLLNKGFASQQTISNYLNGGTDPKGSFLERFIKEYRVSAKWLMTGEEEEMHNSIIELKPYSNQESVNPMNETITLYTCPECVNKQKEINSKQNEIVAQKKTIESLEKQIELLELCLGKTRGNGSG
jgi:transcriptional regulator with XRE-family HTH domain